VGGAIDLGQFLVDYGHDEIVELWPLQSGRGEHAAGGIEEADEIGSFEIILKVWLSGAVCL